MNAIVSFRLCKLTDQELIERIDQQTDDMFRSQKLPARHIPARPDQDYDLLIGELLLRFGESLKQSTKPKYKYSLFHTHNGTSGVLKSSNDKKDFEGFSYPKCGTTLIRNNETGETEPFL